MCRHFPATAFRIPLCPLRLAVFSVKQRPSRSPQAPGCHGTLPSQADLDQVIDAERCSDCHD